MKNGVNLNEFDAAEKESNIKFWTGMRNTAMKWSKKV